MNYIDFLNSAKPELKILLSSSDLLITLNLKLESVHSIPNIENSDENRSFKTSAREVFADIDINILLDDEFVKFVKEQDAYVGKRNGFTLNSIDGMLFGVYRYTPRGGLSYISLTYDISNKKAIINPSTSDQCYFK